MRAALILCAALLAGCTAPPPEAYVGGRAGGGNSATAVAIGSNATGEACTQSQTPGDPSGHEIYCGTWQQPSARIREVPAQPLNALADEQRGTLAGRFDCARPEPIRLLGDAALLMRCTRRVGGWPHLALVTATGGRGFVVDGVTPALPAIERSIGVLTGRVAAGAAAPVDTDRLVERLAAASFGSDDIAAYEDLMNAARIANQAERFAAAETAYRAALAVQEKALGADSPATVAPLLPLALQLSNQGKLAEAGAVFDRAAPLVSQASDRTAPARLIHYRALDAGNRGDAEAALAGLVEAERAYAALVPEDMLQARVRGAPGVFASQALGRNIFSRALAPDPTIQTALIGVIETRRNRAALLRRAGRTAEAQAESDSAETLARANQLDRGLIGARIARTAGVVEATSGRTASADSSLATAAAEFQRGLPRSRPLADTLLLRARERFRLRGDPLPFCREAVRLLRELNEGTEADRLAPCLDALGIAAQARPAQAQALLTEMFEMAQIAQGGVTATQIAQAAARLSESARDPHAAEAIRRRQDASRNLAELYRARDEARAAAAEGRSTEDAAAIDARIAEAQRTLADADTVLQAAAPNYGQLTQSVVAAKDVLAALGPGEALATIALTGTGGWTLVLRDGRLAVGHIAMDTAALTGLVRRIRAGVEAGDDSVPFDLDAAHTLYATLFDEVATSFEGVQALTIAPSGPLLSLPFALLVERPAAAGDYGGAAWMGARFAIAHVPAPANFIALRRAAQGGRAPRPWVGFGDFRPPSDAQVARTFRDPSCARSFRQLRALPGTRLELAAASQIMGARPDESVLAGAFTVEAVRRLTLSDYRVVHFATHGLLPTDLSCLDEPAVLASVPQGAADARGALLSASQLLELKMNADAVILSACNSGGGDGAGGESLSGLARAVFYAGARALLITHWYVDDIAAARLVATALRNVEAGMGLAAAMQAAQKEMRDRIPEWRHPAYWAAFAVIGNGGVPARAVAHRL